jgi:hypothetical protein
VTSGGRDVDDEDELQAKAYEAELQRVAALNAQAWQLDTTFHEKYEAAVEARDLMEIYLADLTLKWRDAQAALLVKELVLSIIPCDPHARPVAGCDGTLIGFAVMPCYALADFELFGLVGFHARCYAIRARG